VCATSDVHGYHRKHQSKVKAAEKNIYKTNTSIHQKLVTAKALLALRVSTSPPIPFSWERSPPRSTSGSCRPTSPAQPRTPVPNKPFLCSFLPSHRDHRSHLCGAPGDPGLGHHTVSLPVTTSLLELPTPHGVYLQDYACFFLSPSLRGCCFGFVASAEQHVSAQASVEGMRLLHSRSPGQRLRSEDGPGLRLHPLQLTHLPPPSTQATGEIQQHWTPKKKKKKKADFQCLGFM